VCISFGALNDTLSRTSASCRAVEHSLVVALHARDRHTGVIVLYPWWCQRSEKHREDRFLASMLRLL